MTILVRPICSILLLNGANFTSYPLVQALLQNFYRYGRQNNKLQRGCRCQLAVAGKYLVSRAAQCAKAREQEARRRPVVTPKTSALSTAPMGSGKDLLKAD